MAPWKQDMTSSGIQGSSRKKFSTVLKYIGFRSWRVKFAVTIDIKSNGDPTTHIVVLK